MNLSILGGYNLMPIYYQTMLQNYNMPASNIAQFIIGNFNGLGNNKIRKLKTFIKKIPVDMHYC